ncbi:MAG: hypothetical protein Q9222_001144 [Ikaeria aurantiellina]
MAAYWLAKAGARVTVIERFPSLRTNGQSIDIRTTGVTVMRKIPGMEDAVRSKRTKLDGISLVREDGRPYGTIKATGNPEQQGLVSEYEILRGDLARILFDLTKDNEKVRYVFDEQIASMQTSEKGDGPVKVEFANGLKAAEYDVVVACDGATSRTRAMGLSCVVRDHITPVNVWAAYFTIEQDLINGSTIGQGYSAIPGRFLALGQDPDGGNTVFLQSVHPDNQQDPTLPFREAMKQSEEELKRFVARRFKGAGWKVDEVMEAMMSSTNFYANEIVQVHVPSLHQDRFVLVGDAGYAPGPTGTGTTLALTGAYVLAGEIGKHKGDLPAGLRAYEERMKPILGDMQKIPPLGLSFAAPQTAWGLWLRNNLFAFVAWTNLVDYVQRFFGGAFGDVDNYNLPDYDWVA